MRFYGEPNLTLIDHKTHKAIGKFDNNGIFETDNEQIIKRMKPLFKYEEPIEEVIEEKGIESEKETKQIFTCKKCGEEFDNRGLFLAHCRQEKKKENKEG